MVKQETGLGPHRTIQNDGRVHGVIVGCQREDARWLLIRRSATVAMPLRVCFPGGGIDGEETQEQAAVREMHEELSAPITPLSCVWQLVAPDRPLTLWGWHAELQSLDVVANPQEVAEVLWLTAEEIRLHPDTIPHTGTFLDMLLEQA